MLQQNNNNNYPCLNVSGSTREMLQKCSRASLPFPSRLELGLGDLPLIRGLRAWALCSKNRCKAGGLLGGGQAPTAPPAGHGSSTTCPRPADVYLSGEWGRMGYGLPLGLDARQAGIGALVTVATLKTSVGSGKTQTQCLFLRTEKGSCLYSTSKPGSGATTSAVSSVVGGWLRGKTGGGGRDAPAGRRDNGQTLPAQTGANRVRVRSGRRWRKSGNAAGREKTGVSRERQQRSREDPADERQEEQDKGGLDSKQFPSLQQDGRKARQEKDGACRSPRCCHNVSPKTCAQCGRRAQRRESQDEGEGGESPGRGASNGPNGEVKGMRKERQKNEEEEKGGLCELESSNPVLALPNPDLESNRFHPQSPGGCDVEEIRETDSNAELKTQTSHSKDSYSEKEQDSNSEIMKIRTGNSEFIHDHSGQLTADFKSRPSTSFDDREPTEGEEIMANVHGFSDCMEADEESEKEMEKVDVEEEERTINQTPAEFSVMSNCYEDISVSTHSAPISTAVSPESSTSLEGSICTLDREACWFKREQEEHLEGYHLGEADPGIMGVEELDVDHQEPNSVTDKNNKPQLFSKIEESNSQLEEREASSSSLRHRDPPIFETDWRIVTENSCDCRAIESERRDELESEEENIEERLNPGEGVEAEEIWRREFTCGELDNSDGRKEVEEDEFGVFMQAEGEPAWSEGFTMSASVPCGSRESVALGNQAITGESTHWTPGWTDSSFHQSDDTWTAFPQDSSHEGRDVVGQWWPTSAVEERRDRLSANQNMAAVFAEAFPSVPGSSTSDFCDLDTVPTLTQLLRGRASQDQGLLDSFHDLNKMIGQRYKRANGVSRDLLLKTLHLEQPHTESRPASWTANRRLSPGLPSANHNAAAKRRLSYDYNRNIME
ncbi:spore wall protein 2 [Lates japonicus]|uniref:Spore wall protein 2 n=1 Tax=Lates japonicus TaxID=270547 RepID=A0AAD3R1P1_LATJO|nr:spore wall protein 2 [Lates japonicus]